MELLDFLNEHEDWESVLTADPYYFKIQKNDTYIHFSVDMEHTTRYNILTLQAHGAIFRKEGEKWICVNYPIPHVLDINESHQINFNWKEAETYSHIDGLMLCVWNDNGKWHFSTDKYLNIADVKGNNQYTGDMLLQEACNKSTVNLTTNLTPGFCYTFILTSPNYKYVADYGPITQLWYITKRSMLTFEEDNIIPEFNLNIQLPHHFLHLRVPHILQELQKIVTENEVGYICVDKNGNRIKVDGDAYAERIKIRGNDVFITPQRIVELWQQDYLENYISLFDNDINIILIKNCIEQLIKDADLNFEKLLNDVHDNKQKFMQKLPRYLPCTCGYYKQRWSDTNIKAEEYFKKAPLQEIMSDIQYEIMRRRIK